VRGHNLTALIFAREVSDPLTGLVKAIDKQLEESFPRRKNGNRFGVFVVFCSNDPGLPKQLQSLIAREGLKHVVFSLSEDRSQGPPRYRVARDAELTVAVYQDRRRVVANFVLDSVDLTADRADEVVAALRKVLP
jgi:hypothetical protein